MQLTMTKTLAQYFKTHRKGVVDIYDSNICKQPRDWITCALYTTYCNFSSI